MSYNRAYHGYFEGYVERQVVDSNGKMKIERVYAGDYYRHKMDDRQWKRLKMRYGLYYLWAVLSMIAAAATGGGTREWYVGIPAMLSVLALLWLGYYVVSYILQPRELMISQFRARKHLSTFALISALSLGCVAVGKAAWMIGNRSVSGLLGTLIAISGIGAVYQIFREEKDMDYVKRANTAPVPGDGYDIRFQDDQ